MGGRLKAAAMRDHLKKGGVRPYIGSSGRAKARHLHWLRHEREDQRGGMLRVMKDRVRGDSGLGTVCGGFAGV